MVTAKKAAFSALETPTPEPEITQVDQGTRYKVNDDVSNILGENTIITSPDMVPAPYVSLIRLSRVQMDGKVDGVPEISGRGGKLTQC